MRPRKTPLLQNGLMKWIGYATAFCALVGSLWGGKVILDTTYASAAEVRKQFDSLQLFLLKKDLRELKKERGELEREKDERGLSQYEKNRLDEIKEEVGTLQEQLKRTK